MEFDTQAYFTEHQDPDTPAFVIIETDESEGYRVAEKWEPDDRESTWLTYWLTESDLLDRIENGHCEKTTEVSDKQFRGLLKLAGVCEQVVA